MLTPRHADILNKPFSQIKDLKQHCPDDLESIKVDHQGAWQVFKAFNLKVYENLPTTFAKPHIQNWCNGWEIRRHFFAYYKYDAYLGNAPIIAMILNRERFMVMLTWHAYKASVSNSTLDAFNRWTDEIDWQDFQGFYVWHSRVNEYGDLTPVDEFDGVVSLQQGEFYRLGRVMNKDELANYDDAGLIRWTSQTIQALAGVYECCHGKSKA